MKSLAYLNKFFWKYRSRLFMGALFVFASNFFDVFRPLLIRQAVDFLVNTSQMVHSFPIEVSLPPIFEVVNMWFDFDIFNQTSFTREDLPKLMTTAGLLVVILYILISVVSGVFLFMTRQTLIIMSRLIEFDLKNTIFAQYQKLNFSFYKVNSTGDLMNRISEDVSKVRMYLGPAVMYTINLTARSILAIYFMVSISPELSLYVLVPLPIMSIIIYVVGRRINKLSEIIQRQQSNLTSFVQESVAGIRILKAFNRTSQFNAFFADETEDYLNKNIDLVKVNSMFLPTIVLIIGVSTLLTIFIGSNMIIDGAGLTPGDLTAFVIYINMLTWPFAAVGWVSSMAMQAAASQERINQFLEKEPEFVSGDFNPTNFNGNIEFENVSFEYPESKIKALKGASFKIESGKTTAIIGKTGSGKSTIANLILRLYDVSDGEIKIDGRSIRDYNLHSLRSNIGYVPQEVFLFSDSIKNNIAFGHPESKSLSEVQEVSKYANVHANIMDFPEQYETKVGEWGITLSGGQKQRVSIARALIRKPQILIFDDSLSAVDTETEEEILNNLKHLMANKTAIMISHRVSSIKNADHILVLDKGVIVEQGTHDELISLNGNYRSIYDKQIIQGVKKVAI
ncbi:MAG: ATP-binding cassette subfamily B multidrug efflux pump [Patiriisocius sp.]|jgi:ATP-binding cassette subfamily B multidrug efflux pump